MRARWISIVWIVSAMGCGSRSPLALGEGGTGGASSTGGTGGTTVVACTALSPRAPALELPGAAPDELDDALELVDLGAGNVAGVFVRKSTDGALGVLHTRLSPWAKWPPKSGSGNVHSAELVVQGTPKTARSPAGGYALAVRVAAGSRLYPSVDPGATGSGAAPLALPEIGPMFVATSSSGASRALVGTFVPNVSRATLVVGSSVTSSVELGCAASSAQPVQADAVEWAGGFLVATSSATPFGGCADPNANGPPTRIEIVWVDGDGSVSSVTGADVGSTVLSLGVAPRADGLWVAWRESGASASPRVKLARVDLWMAQWVGPIAVGTPDEQSFDFAVAALGQRAVVVRRVQSVADTMRVSLFDADLGLVAAGVDTPPPGFGPSSVLGSPSGDSVLVAWTATNPNAYRVHATRFDCVL